MKIPITSICDTENYFQMQKAKSALNICFNDG